MDLKPLIKIVPRKALQGLIFGAFLGFFSWIIQSPVLGTLIGHVYSALITQIISALIVGFYCSIILYRRAVLFPILIIFVSTIILITLAKLPHVAKWVIDILFNRVHEINWILSYVVCYALITMSFVGLIESVKKAKDEPNKANSADAKKPRG